MYKQDQSSLVYKQDQSSLYLWNAYCVWLLVRITLQHKIEEKKLVLFSETTFLMQPWERPCNPSLLITFNTTQVQICHNTTNAIKTTPAHLLKTFHRRLPQCPSWKIIEFLLPCGQSLLIATLKFSELKPETTSKSKLTFFMPVINHLHKILSMHLPSSLPLPPM